MNGGGSPAPVERTGAPEWKGAPGREAEESGDARRSSTALDRAHADLVEAIRAAERARQWNLFLGIGLIAFAAATLALLATMVLTVHGAPRADVDAERLAKAIGEALGPVFSVRNAPAPAGSDVDGRGERAEAPNDRVFEELARVKEELAAARASLEAEQRRAFEEGEAAERLMKLVESRRRGGDAPGDAGPEAGRSNGSVESMPRGPQPLSEASVREVNALIAYATQTHLRLMDGHHGDRMEIRDAVFGKSDPSGRPQGLVTAKRAVFEESGNEPRLRLRLEDGQDVLGANKVPFLSRTIEFRAVDPAEWKRRLPEIFRTADAPDVGAPSAASAQDASARALQLRPLVQRINDLLSKHTDYVHLRLEDLTMAEGEFLYGVTFSSLVKDRGAAEPRVESEIRARRAAILYKASLERLEIEFEDGHRAVGSRRVPFPGGKLRLIVPGVKPAELETGEVPLPVRRG